LNQENKRRDREPRDETYDNVYIEKIGSDGVMRSVKVDKVRTLPINLVRL
jgi:MFS transporter, ACS family, allantoate permease